MGTHPGVVECRVVGDEIEHEPETAGCEPSAKFGQRFPPAKRLIDLIGTDREAGTADVLLCQIRQNCLELGPPGGISARQCPAGRAGR